MVIWTLGLFFEMGKFGIEIIHSDENGQLSFWHKFKLDSLENDKPYYSLSLFACIFITEYLPMSTLQFSLLKSYRNNREKKCGTQPDNEEDLLEYGAGNNEYNCDYMSEAERRPLNRGATDDDISKRSGDTSPIFV
jgi:hypothetical protein